MPKKLAKENVNIAEDVVAAWSAYCQRLDALGREIVAAYAPNSAVEAAETLRHMTRLLRTSLEWQVDSRDSKNPRLTWYDRSCAGVAPYGPNIDNSYLLVRVDDEETYRLKLNVSEIDEVNISVHTGSPYDGNTKVYGDLNLADFDIKNGEGEILFSRSPQTDAWFELPEGAEYVFIRLYYFDWARTAPPAIEFECISNKSNEVVQLDPQEFVLGLQEATHWLGGALHFGHAFGRKFLEGGSPNTPGPLRSVPGGGSKIRYGGFRFILEPDFALIVEFEKPKARYWSIQWQRLPWADPIDYFHRQMSLNHTQLDVDTDGKIRVVISHTDPGVRNWLDTGHNREGFVMYRWIWSSTEPQPVASLVEAPRVREVLPPTTAYFGKAFRAAAISDRRRHLLKRF